MNVCIAPFRRDPLDLDKKTERTHSGFRSYVGCQSAFLSCRERVRRQLRCVRCRFLMRILLLPRSIEHQFVKKVGQCPDVLDLMRVILAPGPGPGLSCSGGARSAVGDARDLVLAVCRDGDCDGYYGDPEAYAARVARHLESLCALMGLRAGIAIRIFSFMDDDYLMMATLRGCDIFYMAGIYRVSEQWA